MAINRAGCGWGEPMSTATTHGLAGEWLDRWARCQVRYSDFRSERTSVVGDIIDAAARRLGETQAVVLDLGCGPGDLTASLAQRLPAATVVGIDRDPFLIGLGRAAHPGIRLQVADLHAAGAAEVLTEWGPPTVIVASSVFHYPAAPDLVVLIRRCAEALRPGGILVDVDHMPPRDPGLREIVTALAPDDADPDSETWDAWWHAARKEPAFADSFAERDRLIAPHGADNDLDMESRRELLSSNGFRDAAAIWQRGRSVILAGVRSAH